MHTLCEPERTNSRLQLFLPIQCYPTKNVKMSDRSEWNKWLREIRLRISTR